MKSKSFCPKKIQLEDITERTGKDIQILRLVGHSELNPVELILARVKL